MKQKNKFAHDNDCRIEGDALELPFKALSCSFICKWLPHIDILGLARFSLEGIPTSEPTFNLPGTATTSKSSQIIKMIL